MAATGGVLTKLKQPEYTGENRCMPCTVVNTVIAGVLSVAVGVGTASSASTAAGAGVGGGVFLVSLLAIYLRGYLVPGTPELTKQYFPVWLLKLFGKGPAQAHSHEHGGEHGELDPEAVLTSVGALEECQSGNDLCLTDSFRTAWHDEIERVDTENVGREQLLGLLDVDSGAVEYEEFGDAFRATVDDEVVGKWESEGAFLADLGAANVLAERHPDWEGLSLAEKSQLLNGMRLFVDTCPECGGVPEFDTETVESCCSTHEVAAVSCQDCGARLFESHT